MKALHNRAKRSARERREDEMLLRRTFNTVELALYLMCVSLNDRRGFGEKRCGETIQDIFSLLDHYTERYGSDCVITAVKKDLSDRKIFIEIKGE